MISTFPLQTRATPFSSKVLQRQDEWKNLDPAAYAYHLHQWDDQKWSTHLFADFVADLGSNSHEIVDLGCAAGAATFCLAQRCPAANFVGVDYSAELIGLANKLAEGKQTPNLSFTTGDWFNLNCRGGVDGVVSLQTLSWLPEFERPLQEICQKLNLMWVAVSSLFYGGDISCTIEVNEHSRERKSFYNVYLSPAVMWHAGEFGFQATRKIKFVTDIDVAKPENIDLMGTHTVLAKSGAGAMDERLQISGPLLLNWYFLLIERV